MATNDEVIVAVGNNDDDDHNGYNDDENILIPWNNPIIQKLGLKWGEYYVIDVQDGEYTDDEECESVDDISEVEEDEESKIVWMDMDNNREPVMNAVAPLLSYDNGSSIQATAKDETSSFICLSEVLLENIFMYAAFLPSDVLPIEKTCKKFHKVLRADGNFWDRHLLFRKRASTQIKDAPSTREKVFCYYGLGMIRKTPKSDVNFLLQFLKINFNSQTDDEMLKIAGENFKYVATRIMSKMMTMHQQGVAIVSIRLRGDTIGYLTELLQGYMVGKLKNALLMAVHRADGSYPTVTKDDILVLDKFTSTNNSTGLIWHWPDDNCLSEDVLPSEIRRKIIRMIAYQAGITKMTGEAFAVAEAKLFHTMGLLLVNAYDSSMNYNYSTIGSYQIIYPSTDNVSISDVDSPITQDVNTQRRLIDSDAAVAVAAAATTAEQERIVAAESITYYSTTMFSVPPPPVFSLCDDDQTPNKYEYIIYTIVPGQIKEAARQNNITPNIVYDDLNWLACPGSTVEEEMKIEIAYYDWDKRTITSPQHKNGQDWDDDADLMSMFDLGDY